MIQMLLASKYLHLEKWKIYVRCLSKPTWLSKADSLQTKRECSSDRRKLEFLWVFHFFSETSAYSHPYRLTIFIVLEQLLSIWGLKHVFFLPANLYFERVGQNAKFILNKLLTKIDNHSQNWKTGFICIIQSLQKIHCFSFLCLLLILASQFCSLSKISSWGQTYRHIHM